MIKKFFDRLVSNNEEFNEYLNITLTQDKINVTRKAAYLAAAVVSIFSVVDILSTTSPAKLNVFLLIRACMTANFLIIVYLSKQHKDFFLKQYHFIVSIAFIFSGFGIIAMIHLSEAGGIVHSTYFAGLMLVIMAMFSWFSLNTIVTVSIGFLITFGYIVVYLLKTGFTHYADTLLLNNLVFLLAAITFGLVTDVYRKHYLFKHFISQKRLIEFLLPKPNKEISQFNNEVFLTKSEFQQVINNSLFDAHAANLKLILNVISYDTIENIQLKESNLINDVLNVLYKQSNLEIKTYKDGDTIWSLSFTNESLESFNSHFETNIKKYLKEYKKIIEVKTATLEIDKENDFKDQKNHSIRELKAVSIKPITPNISLVKK